MIEKTLNDPNFKLYAALLSEPYHSPKWHEENPDIDFWAMEDQVCRALGRTDKLEDKVAEYTSDTYSLTEAVLMMLLAVHNKKLRSIPLAVEATIWLTNLMMDAPRMRVVVPMMLGIAASTPVYLSITDVAKETDMSEAAWRVRCRNGDVLGAVQIGSTWLIPEFALILMGIRK